MDIVMTALGEERTFFLRLETTLHVFILCFVFNLIRFVSLSFIIKVAAVLFLSLLLSPVVWSGLVCLGIRCPRSSVLGPRFSLL